MTARSAGSATISTAIGALTTTAALGLTPVRDLTSDANAQTALTDITRRDQHSCCKPRFDRRRREPFDR